MFKILLGITGVYIIYLRINKEFGLNELNALKEIFTKLNSFSYILVCLILITLNWGLEALKWQIITKSIEPIDYLTATKSVYSGICIGNFSPGRATEFLGKILFFSDANKGKISVLHFVNGMIQLSITLLAGMLALAIKLDSFSYEYEWLINVLLYSAVFLFVLFGVVAFKINYFLKLVSKFLSRFSEQKQISVKFPLGIWARLFLFSILRYMTFSLQFYLLLKAFHPNIEATTLLPGIALYFMITSLVPMISVLEAAIRAAIALVVLSDSGLNATTLAFATVLLWMFNIVVPSIIGYIVLFRLKFDFKIIYKRKA